MEQSMVFFYCTYRKKGMANKAVTEKIIFARVTATALEHEVRAASRPGVLQ